MAQPFQPFDVGALYSTLDSKRNMLDVSWQSVAAHLWKLSRDLSARGRSMRIRPILAGAFGLLLHRTSNRARFPTIAGGRGTMLGVEGPTQ